MDPLSAAKKPQMVSPGLVITSGRKFGFSPLVDRFSCRMFAFAPAERLSLSNSRLGPWKFLQFRFSCPAKKGKKSAGHFSRTRLDRYPTATAAGKFALTCHDAVYMVLSATRFSSQFYTFFRTMKWLTRYAHAVHVAAGRTFFFGPNPRRRNRGCGPASNAPPRDTPQA